MAAQVAIITNVGLKAAFTAQAGGAKFKIDHFKIGSDAGFEPLSSDTDVHTPVYTGNVNQLSYRIDSPNRIVYRVLLDGSVGGFYVGNIGLYLDTGELFALCSLVDKSHKTANALPNVVGDFKHYDIIITFANIGAMINFTLSQTSPTDVPAVSTEAGLPLPDAAPFKIYIVRNHTVLDKPALAYTDTTQWIYMPIQEEVFNLYLENFASGLKPLINGAALNSIAIGHGAKIDGSGQRSVALGLCSVEGNDNFVAQTGTNSAGVKTIGNNLVAIGSFNRAGTSASHEFNIVVGGSNNLIEGLISTIVGGRFNKISADYATIIGGAYAWADIKGQNAYAGGRFSDYGDAQRSDLMLRGITTSAVPTEITVNADGDQIVLKDKETISFVVDIVARRTDGLNESFAKKISGVIDRQIGVATCALVSATNDDLIATDRTAWNAVVVADTSTGALKVVVTGEASKTIRWVAHAKLVQVRG